MERKKNIARLLILTVALTSLTRTVTLTSPRSAHAQTIEGTWAITGSLNVPRAGGQTATLLPNGKVLTVGGVNRFMCCYATLNSAELYDPVTGAWALTGNLIHPRQGHTATLLRNGQVLVAGGYIYGTSASMPLSSTEIFDPDLGAWRSTGSLKTITVLYYATLLGDGKVMAVGTSSHGLPNPAFSAELYDPSTGTWTSATAPLSFSCDDGRGSLTLLPSGKVLGLDGETAAELYDPATGTWSNTGSFNTIQKVSTASLLHNGNVLVTGWVGSSPGAEIFDPNTGTWRVTGKPPITGTAAVLSDGGVLLIGEYSAYESPTSGSGEQLYDPATGTWSQTSLHNPPRSEFTATLLSDGRVLVAGGADQGFDWGEVIFNNAEVYTTGAGPNTIDYAQFFVTQQYRDFFGREPDAIGFQNWFNTLVNCPNGGFGEFDNPHCDRVHVSAGFFQSNEFQGRGYWILRFGFVGLNRSVGSTRSSTTYAEFIPALQQIGGSNSPAQEEAAKVAYTNAFVQRSDFQALFPAGLSNSQYVNGLESNAGVTLNNKQALIDGLNNMSMTRADVLRNVVESQIVFDKFLIPSFVTMEYFGYLRRDVDEVGYRNWVDTLTADPGNYRHMIFGFIYSNEYRARFGQP